VPEVRERFQRTIPMQRLGLPVEVATLAAWLYSDQASFILARRSQSTAASLPAARSAKPPSRALTNRRRL
jgi:NAD(P)-dependent dehydrogenase (short-subunit alcohol dehydrogenase family)